MGQDCLRPKTHRDLLCPPQGLKPGPADAMGAQTSALGTLMAHRAHLCSQAAPLEYGSRKCLGLPRETLLLLSVTSNKTGCLGGLLVWGRCGGAGSGLGEAFALSTNMCSCPWFSIQGAWAICSYQHRLSALTPGLLPKGEATWETGQSMRLVSPVSTLCPALPSGPGRCGVAGHEPMQRRGINEATGGEKRSRALGESGVPDPLGELGSSRDCGQQALSLGLEGNHILLGWKSAPPLV